MKKLILFFLLFIFGLLVISMAFVVLGFAWDFIAEYDFSISKMSSMELGFFIGFTVMGIIFLTLGFVITLVGYKKSIRRMKRIVYRRMRRMA